MKKMKVIFVSALLFLFSQNNFAQSYEWEDLGLVASGDIRDIEITSNGYIFLADLSGVIRSTDNGETWEDILTVEDQYDTPEALTVDSLDNIFVCLFLSNILKSEDYGNTWLSITDSLDSSLKYYNLVSTSETLVISTSSFILVSADDGQTWTHASIVNNPNKGDGINSSLFENFFHLLERSSSGTIFAAGDGWNPVIKSTDNGYNWIFLDSTPISATGLTIFSNGTVFISDYNAIDEPPVIKSTDDGETWISATDYFSNEGSGVMKLFATSENSLISSAVHDYDYGIYYSDDGGVEWKKVFDTTELYTSSFEKSLDGYIYLSIGSNLYRINESLLPVELISFTARADGNDVTLNWTTATETNNKGFEIERARLRSQKRDNVLIVPASSNNDYAETSWKKIGFVEGSGTTTEARNYSFKDENLEKGKYLYRLKQIDYDGRFEYSKTVEVEIDPIYKFTLEQNYPNPFSKLNDGNSTTTIKFTLPAFGGKRIYSSPMAQLKIYDMLGREVATLVNEKLSAGEYEVKFDGSGLPSGIYLYRLQAGSFSETKKMILLR